MFFVHGLLAIHVLAGAGGVHSGRRMPVRPGRDQHGIDILAVEQLAEVAILCAVVVAVMLVGNFLDRIAANLFHVAHGQELNVLLLQEAAEIVRAPVADADAAHRDALARRDVAVEPECRARQNRKPGRGQPRTRRPFEKTTTRYKAIPPGIHGNTRTGLSRGKVAATAAAAFIPYISQRTAVRKSRPMAQVLN